MEKVSAVVTPRPNSRRVKRTISFSELKETLRQKLINAKAFANDYKHHFASYVSLKTSERNQLALSYAYLTVIMNYASHRVQRELIFEILNEELKDLSRNDEPLTIAEGELGNEETRHRIPISTKTAFKKYCQRAKDKGILGALISRLRNKPSNNSKMTQILKDVITFFAIKKTTHTSSKEIHEDLEVFINAFPEVVEQGVTLISPSRIREFFRTEGAAYISYAKDNPLEFRKKILGCLRFLPPSAPLIRVGIDGYLFQVVCEDDETQKPIQLVGEFVDDYKSGAVLGLAFGRTESNITLRRALRDYLKTTDNRLFRELVMDRFSSHNCAKIKNFLKILDAYGVKTKMSSNPNNNSRLENFFGVFQDECLGTFMQSSFIGSGVKSNSLNAHPAKKVLLKIKKKDFLMSEGEMIAKLTYLIKEYYNKNHKVSGDRTPMGIFSKEASNHVAILTDREVAFSTFDKHKSTIIGGGVHTKRGEHLYLYKNRDYKIIIKDYRRVVNTYIDPDDNSKLAYLFQRGTRVFLYNMDNIAIVPCTIFDRTEEQKTMVNSFNKETRELILAIKKDLSEMELRVETLVGGKDILQHTKVAKIKKDMDSAYLAQQIGVVDKLPEPTTSYPNDPVKHNKQKKKSNEEMLIDNWL